MRPAWPSDPVELLAILYPRLLSAARGLVAQGGADDLVQDTLVEILVRHPDFRGISYPLGYGRTVMFRLAAAARRRAAREIPLDLQEHLDSEVPAPDESVANTIDLRAGLESLGRKQRAAIVLRFHYRLDTREIARVLGSSEATVRSQIMRGLRKLRVALDRRGPALSDSEEPPREDLKRRFAGTPPRTC